MAEEDYGVLDLFDSDLEEELKHEAVKASMVSFEETQKRDGVSVTPQWKDGSSLIRTEPQEDVPDYEEIEDDFPLTWMTRKESFGDSSSKGILENKDDSGIDIKPDHGFTFDHLDSPDIPYPNEPTYTSKERCPRFPIRTSTSDMLPRDKQHDRINGTPVLRDTVTTDITNTGTFLKSVLKGSYLPDFQNVPDHSREDGQGRWWKLDEDSKDSLPDLPDLSLEVKDRLSPSIDLVTMDADMADDSFMAQDYYCMSKTDKGKKSRLHPYTGEVLGKGKHNAKGQTRVKASNKTQILPKQLGSGEKVVAAPLKTLSYQVPNILPPGTCSLENKDDSGIDMKPGHGFIFDHVDGSDAPYPNEPKSISKDKQPRFPLRTSTGDALTSNELYDRINGSPVLQDIVTTYNTKTGTSLKSVLKESYLPDLQNVQDYSRQEEQGRWLKSDADSKDSLPDLPDLSLEVKDRLSPSIDLVAMETDIDDSFMVQDFYCKSKTDKGEKSRLHPHMGEVLGKGKRSAKGPTRIKASKNPQKLPKQLGSGEKAVAAPLKTLSYQVPNILPPVPPPREPVAPPSLECEACHMLKSQNSIVQCCEGHVVCTQCVEKEAKLVIVGTKKGSVACSVALCNSSIPQSTCSLENKDDSGIDMKPGHGFTFDHLDGSDAPYTNEPKSISKDKQPRFPHRTSTGDALTSNQLYDRINGSPVLQDIVTTYNTKTGTSLKSVLKESYLPDLQNVQDHSRQEEQGRWWKSDEDSKDSLPDLPDLSLEVKDRLSPSIDLVAMETDIDDSFMVQDYYCKSKTDKWEKSRLHPHMGEVLGKGKCSAKGPTRIKASKSPQKLPKQLGSGEKAVAAPLKTLSYQVPNILPPVPPPREPVAPPSLECEACHVLKSQNSIVQCCEGHVVCTQCVEKEAKLVIVGPKKGSVACSVALCNSSIPQSELRKSLPSIVLDLLEESWKKETLEALENMKDGVKCPGCSNFGVLDSHIKNFKCVNCRKTYCRLCQLEWHVKRHDLCIKMTKKVSEATGHTIHIPAHWTVDVDTERQVGYSVEILDQMSEEYLNILSQFFKSQQKTSVSVNKIYRVQNQRLWEKYSLFQMHMIQDIGEMYINERRLFHGTNTEVIDSICKEGFDWRLCGKNGTAYGHGTYFAKDSVYSLRYSLVSDGNWTPPMGHTPAKTLALAFPPSYTTFPPSYTQSLRFNVLTGSPPSQPVPVSALPLIHLSGVPAPIAGHHVHGGNRPASSTGPAPIQMNQMSGSTIFTVPSASAGPAQASTTHRPTSAAFTSPLAGINPGCFVFTADPNSNADPKKTKKKKKSRTNKNVSATVQVIHRNLPTSSVTLAPSGVGINSMSTPNNLSPISALAIGMLSAKQPLSGSTSSLNGPSVPPTSSPASSLHNTYSLRTGNLVDEQTPQVGLMNYMFVGRVLVGRKCLGKPKLRRPEKDALGNVCHTAVDNVHHSRIYVVFESGQCYPEYLIEFSK